MDPVEIAAIAAGVEQLVTLGVQVYQQLANKNPAIKPLADILATADANFRKIETIGAQEANS